MASSNKRVVKKRRIKYKNIFVFLFSMIFLVIFVYCVFNIKTKNIFIEGNMYLSDQNIIDEADLKDYPTLLSTNSRKIKSKLEDNIYVKKVDVTRTNLFQTINIKVEENKPVLFYEYDNIYLLENGEKVKKKYDVPMLINQTPEDKLKKLTSKLGNLDDDIIGRISEIRYFPTEADEDLFYLTMVDGNYIYINFNSFDKLDYYVEIVRNLNNKKGIIHLDSGNYLELFKN